MTSLGTLLSLLAPDYTVVQRGRSLFHIVEDHGDTLDYPVELCLDEEILDAYLVRLIRYANADDVDDALGLVRVYVDEDVQSSLAAGTLVTRLGVQRDKVTGEVHWFSDRPPAPDREEYVGNPLEWRAH